MNRSKTPVSSLVVLTAGAMALLLIDTRHAGPDDANYKLSIDDGTDPSDGGGIDIKKSDGVDTNVISSVDAGTGQQMQAQTSDAVAPGSELSTKAGIDDANKVNDGSDAGLGKTDIKDPSAGNDQTQQV